MMRVMFWVFFSLIGLMATNADSLSYYRPSLLKTIPMGKETGQIGWFRSIAGSETGPSSFIVTDKNIYIPDVINNRLNVYDVRMKFVESMVGPNISKVMYANYLRLDDEGNFFSFSSDGITKLNQRGQMLFTINNIRFSREAFNGNFFAINSYYTLYDDKFNLVFLNNEGKILDTIDVVNELEKLSGKEMYDKSLTPKDRELLDNLRKEGIYLLIGDKFYSSNFHQTIIFFDKIKSLRRTIKNRSGITVDFHQYDFQFIGYDRRHNSYWNGLENIGNQNTRMQIIVIYSKYGELLDAFYFGQITDFLGDRDAYQTSDSHVAVSPSGDLYFLSGPRIAHYQGEWDYLPNIDIEYYKKTGEKPAYAMYKIERQWDM